MKSKVVAGVLGILLGGWGAHKFYLGKIGSGILYILFCWTGIPSIVGLIEGIMYLVTDEKAFNEKYCKAKAAAAPAENAEQPQAEAKAEEDVKVDE